MISNEQRAERALDALGDFEADLYTQITDLVADLRHLAHQEGINFERVITTSEIHFNAEA